MKNKLGRIALLGALVGAPTTLFAGSFTTDFNGGLPLGSSVYGNAVISPSEEIGRAHV